MNLPNDRGEPLSGAQYVALMRELSAGKDRRADCWDRQLRAKERGFLCKMAGCKFAAGMVDPVWSAISISDRQAILDAAMRVTTWARGLDLTGPWGSWAPVSGEAQGQGLLYDVHDFAAVVAAGSAEPELVHRANALLEKLYALHDFAAARDREVVGK